MTSAPRKPDDEGRRVRTRPEAGSLALGEAPRKPHCEAEAKTERSGALTARASAPIFSRKTSGNSGITSPPRGPPSSLTSVSPSDALTDRTDEEGCPDFTRPPRAHPKLLSRPEGGLQRCKIEGSTTKQKSLLESPMVPDVPSHRTRLI